ncbi:MAG: acyl carrier protein [Terriglobales bacterium]
MPPPDGLAAHEDHLRRFILTELAGAPDRHLDPDAPLFETLLDSTSVLALVSHLEQAYQIEVLDSEVVPANFTSLRRLCTFVTRKAQPPQLAANG